MEMNEQEIHDLTERLIRMSERMAKGESTPQMELGFSDEEMEAMYAAAYNYSAQGRHEQARQCFKMLLFFDPYSYRYCLGMACSLHLLGNLEQACVYYLLAGALDESQPAPCLHMAECLIQLDDLVGAGENLEKALALCVDGQAHQELRGRIEIMLEHVREKLKQARD